MLDCHVHLIPAVDDGPSSMDIADQVLDAEVGAGVTEVVATPHHLQPQFEPPRDLAERIHAWQERCAQRHPQLITHVGAENHIGGQLATDVIMAELIPLGPSKLFLLEPPNEHCPDSMWDICWRLGRKDQRAIIAHPERCQALRKGHSYKMMANAVAEGAILQIDLQNLLGDAGRSVEKNARKLIKKFPTSCIVASDAHNVARRAPAWGRMPQRYAPLIPKNLRELESWGHGLKSNAVK